MRGVTHPETHEALVARLEGEKQWRLSEDQRETYVSFLRTLPAVGETPRETILENYHLESIAVELLLDASAPLQGEAWKQVQSLVRNIIRKNTYIPINDQSLEESDLIQIVMAEITSGLEHFGYRSRLNTWIHQITINSLRRGYRDRNTHRRKGSTRSLTDNVPESYNPTMAEARWRALLEEITTLLRAQNDPRLIVVFYMSIVEGRRLSDIGENLRLSVARVHSLRKQVRQVLCANQSLREHAREAGIMLQDLDDPDDS